jgi:hypothetical protein
MRKIKNTGNKYIFSLYNKNLKMVGTLIYAFEDISINTVLKLNKGNFYSSQTGLF